MYERLTRYAGTLASRETDGAFGTIGLDDFFDDFYGLDGFVVIGYGETLKRYGIEMPDEGFVACNVEEADLTLVRTLITTCVRQDRFGDGLLGRFARNGFLDRCLTRLKELDEA